MCRVPCGRVHRMYANVCFNGLANRLLKLVRFVSLQLWGRDVGQVSISQVTWTRVNTAGAKQCRGRWLA